MAFTSEDVAALKAAIAKGARRVRQGDEEVEYSSLDEMLRALRIMQAEVDGGSASNLHVSYPRTSRGL